MDRSNSVFIAVRASLPRGSTRGSVLLGTAASIASVGLFATPALTQQTADDFLKLSRAITGHNNLDPITATR
jgi:Membrane bound FAD containing D-sorbitol dehydrogenase